MQFSKKGRVNKKGGEAVGKIGRVNTIFAKSSLGNQIWQQTAKRFKSNDFLGNVRQGRRGKEKTKRGDNFAIG